MVFFLVLSAVLLPAAFQNKPASTDLTAITVTPKIVTVAAQKQSDPKTEVCTQPFKAEPTPKGASLKDLKWELDPSDSTSGSINSEGCYTVPTRENNQLPPAGRVTVKATADNITGTATKGVKNFGWTISFESTSIYANRPK